MSFNCATLCGHAKYEFNIFVSLIFLIAGAKDPTEATQKGVWSSEPLRSHPSWPRCNDETWCLVLGLVVQLLTSRQIRKQRTQALEAERDSHPQGLSLMPCPKDFTASQAAPPPVDRVFK